MEWNFILSTGQSHLYRWIQPIPVCLMIKNIFRQVPWNLIVRFSCEASLTNGIAARISTSQKMATLLQLAGPKLEKHRQDCDTTRI